MFLIKALSNSDIWNNDLNDDFIQFLPNHFNCSPEDLIIHYIPKELKKTLDEYAKKENQKVEYVDGKAKKFKTITTIITKEIIDLETKESKFVDSEQKTEVLDEEISLIPLVSSWPYEKVNDVLIFKGIQLNK